MVQTFDIQPRANSRRYKRDKPRSETHSTRRSQCGGKRKKEAMRRSRLLHTFGLCRFWPAYDAAVLEICIRPLVRLPPRILRGCPPTGIRHGQVYMLWASHDSGSQNLVIHSAPCAANGPLDLRPLGSGRQTNAGHFLFSAAPSPSPLSPFSRQPVTPTTLLWCQRAGLAVVTDQEKILKAPDKCINHHKPPTLLTSSELWCGAVLNPKLGHRWRSTAAGHQARFL